MLNRARPTASGLPVAVLLAVFLPGLGGCATAVEGPFEPEIPPLPEVPLGLDASLLKVPADNPITPEKAALGWQLFYDRRLSADGSIACSSCHVAEYGFGDPDAVSLGVNRARGRRNSNPVINAAFNATQFWDGRAPSLEAQALGPLQDPAEMASTLENIELRLARIEGYRAQFATVFGSAEITADRVAKAIATFERMLLAGDSPWDRWTATGDETAVSESARRGHELLLGKAGCSQCHVGSVFTDAPFGIYHNTGVSMNAARVDLGRYEVTGADVDRGAFKTPTLRNVAQTAPYMHNGSFATLEQVIDFYDAGGLANAWLDPKMGRPLGLTDQDKEDLIEFMHSLTGQVPEWTTRAPALPPSPPES